MHETEGSEEIIPCELCLISVGFLGAEKYVADAFGVELSQRGTVLTERDSFTTSADKIFTAGDMHIGQSLVVRAIREGRDSAREADNFLMGYSNL